jgi:hypothetical protein
VFNICLYITFERYHSEQSLYFLIASLAPHTEHFPSAVTFGCSLTSAPQIPHFGIKSPPQNSLTCSQAEFCI